MKDLTISTKCFINEEASSQTKAKVMAYVNKNKIKKLPINRYNHRYKVAIIPVMSSVFLLGGYLLYQGTTVNSVDSEITQTQSTINDLVAMIDSESF